MTSLDLLWLPYEGMMRSKSLNEETEVMTGEDKRGFFLAFGWGVGGAGLERREILGRSSLEDLGIL